MRSLAALLVLLLSASSVQAQSVTIAWDPSPSTNVTGYRVYRDGVASTGLVTTLQAVVPIVYDIAHTIHVTAIDSAGLESVPSNSVTAFRAAPSPSPLPPSPDGTLGTSLVDCQGASWTLGPNR